MSSPINLNLKAYQGTTFREVLRWESDTKVYVPITSVARSAPVLITTQAPHNIPDSWRVKITNVIGMTEINSTGDTYHVATVVDPTTININKINAIPYKDYTSGGVIEYNMPSDLTGYTGRMHVRNKLADELPLLELTTENGGIIINPTNYTITIYISAEATALLSFSSAVYSLELVNGTEVTSFIRGSISLEKEVTR